MLTHFKPRQLLLAAALGSTAALTTPSALANDADLHERRRVLELQKAGALARLDRVDDLARAEGYYMAIRGAAFDGEQVLPARSGAWQARARAWLALWNTLLDAVEGARETDAEALRLVAKQTIDKQLIEIEGLRREATSLVAKATSAQRELAGIDTYPTAYIAGYESHIAAFNQRVSELRGSLTAFEQQYGRDYVARWNELTESTQAAVLNKLRAAMLRYPELEATVTLAQQAFQVAEMIDRPLETVGQAFTTFNSHHLGKRPFHRDDALAALRTVAAKARQDIAASGLDARFKTPAFTEIDNKVATAEQMASQPAPFTRAQLVASYARAQQRILSLRCRDPERARTLNCELLRTLNRFDTPSITAMADADLRALEYAFDQVQAGPVFNSTALKGATP